MIAYVTAGVVFLAIDAVWLTVMANNLYRPLLGDKLMEQFSLTPAVLFYLIYIAGIVIFAIGPALAKGRWQHATLMGAALGFVAYSTYDLTNQATLRDWPVAITVADIIWGTVLTGIAATCGFLVANSFRT